MLQQDPLTPLCSSVTARALRLRREVEAADRDRRVRYSTEDEADFGRPDFLDELFVRSGRLIDCSLFLNRVIGRTQMKADRICVVETRIERLIVDRLLGRCLATIVCELIHAGDRGADSSGPIGLLCVVGTHADHVILTVAFEGDVPPVPTAAGMNALNRARWIVEALGGILRRKAEGNRMLVGLAVPACPIDEAHPKRHRPPGREDPM